MPNHDKSKPARVSPLSIEILQYLERSPRASDTLLGIARWWILRQRIEALTTEVKDALDELLDLGFLIRKQRPHAQPTYSLNHQKVSDCRTLLNQQKEN